MEIRRTSYGFSVRGKYQQVDVKFVTLNNERWAAIYECKDSPFHAFYIQPINDRDLYKVAYRHASMCARYEFHPHG